MEINNIRKDFPILKNDSLVYFDNASTTQKPTQVITKITNYYKNYNSNIHRGSYEIAEKATLEYENSRIEISKFLNCQSKEIIFTKGTTESINLLAYSLSDTFLKKGDEIIISEMEHHSNIVPWQILSEKYKLKLKYIPISKKGNLKLENITNLITDKTKLISITHMSNLLGEINPIEDIISIAKNNNILTIIDAAQSISHDIIDVQKLQCDFLVFSGHKIFGPTGVGVLYGKINLLDKMSPFLGGGHMIKNVTMEKSEWGELPFKFEAGTPNIAQAIGLGEAIKYFKNNYNEKNKRYLKELRDYLLEKLLQIQNIELFPELNYQNNKGPIIAFNIKNIHAFDISKLLSTRGICIRSGHHCALPILNKFKVNSVNRASLYYYNTKEEVDYFHDSLKEIIKKLS